MKHIFISILYVSLIVAAASCEHKELCFDHSHIQDIDVRLDWSHAPEANPENMSVYLFPEGKVEGWRYDFSNPDGATIRVPKGVYDVVCFNSDSEIALYRNTDKWETIEVSTHETSLVSKFGMRSGSVPRAEGTSHERVAFPPDHLWCDSMSDYEVEVSGDNDPIVLHPENAVQTFTVSIRNVQNMKYASWFTASISTMAGGVLVAEKKPTDELVTIPFDLNGGAEDNTIEGTFRIFGHCTETDGTHMLTIYVQMTGGDKCYYTFDVTEKLHQAEKTGEFNIVIDELPLPKPIINGGGLRPGVDGWNEIDIDIKM